ncbi:MAG TPA: histidine kinase [Mycobacteriales bacterium]|jgi:signal transduction histidine kinase|nr:histidine kinase [Mycobacteriales bacterium]
MRGPSTVRRAIVALAMTALLAFAFVGTAATLVARNIAEDQALAESVRSASSVANVLFAPAMIAVFAGDTKARSRLDAAVRIRGREGAIIRVKVWDDDGLVRYSDDPGTAGRKYAFHPDVQRVFDGHRGLAHLSDLADPENDTEAGLGRLVEAYVPLLLDDGRRLVLEVYSTTDRVDTAKAELVERLVPAALIALLVLVVAQLPVSVWLVRRVGRSQEERSRLLRSALTASDRERRTIARDLHDSVVQDLTGASYALGALNGPLGTDLPPRARSILHDVSTVVGGAIGGLRALLVDIYPPELTRSGLGVAIDDLAADLDQVEVSVRTELAADPSREVAATVYRGAREALVNVGKHAGARHAWVELTGDASAVRLRVWDDGHGLPAGAVAERDGHLGLRLLRDAATDLGGGLHVGPGPAGGLEVVLDLPTAPL